MRLGSKFIVPVAALLAFTLGLDVAYNVQRQRDLALEQLRELGRAQGEFLALIAPDAILGYDFVRLNQHVEQVSRQSDIAFAAVFDAQGRPLTSFTGRAVPVLGEVSTGEDAGTLVQRLAHADGVLLQRHAMVHRGQRLGTVAIALDRSRIERLLERTILRQLLVYAAIIGVLGTSIYLVFKVNVLRPVRALIEGAGRVGRGDYERSVPVLHDDELGTLSETFNAMMSEIQRERTLLNYQATHDLLTGLANRYRATERVLHEIELARRGGSGFALLFIDLDNFKNVNDTHGHAVGDRLLVEVSRRFEQEVRAVDLLARLGGDEYLVLLPGLDSAARVRMVVDRLTAIAEQPIYIDGLAIHARCSVGIALYPQDGEEVGSLMAAADSAMYAAKRDPGRAASFFTQEMNEAAKRQVELEHAIHQALAEEAFSLVYQPVVRARDGRCVGVEALLRWEHPQLGTVPPLHFVPIAERSGQIVALGNWVLERACADLAALEREGMTLGSVAINVSRNQLCSGFDVRVLETLRRHGLAPQRLVLELTESILVEEHSDAAALLATWREAGVRLALDDFGTGFSSLGYLRRFDFDILKIDKSFVDGLPHDPDSAALVAAICAIGVSLGMEVVAEGVETAAQRAHLSECGGSLLQGYHIARPMSLEPLRRYLGAQQGYLSGRD